MSVAASPRRHGHCASWCSRWCSRSAPISLSSRRRAPASSSRPRSSRRARLRRWSRPSVNGAALSPRARAGAGSTSCSSRCRPRTSRCSCLRRPRIFASRMWRSRRPAGATQSCKASRSGCRQVMGWALSAPAARANRRSYARWSAHGCRPAARSGWTAPLSSNGHPSNSAVISGICRRTWSSSPERWRRTSRASMRTTTRWRSSRQQKPPACTN